jgi:hypothetical protein
VILFATFVTILAYMRALTLWAFHSDLSSIHPPIMQRLISILVLS